MSNATNLRFLVLTGEPGVGKTTLIKKLASYLTERGVRTCGFYTEEVRKNRVREGFDVVTFENIRGPLARELSALPGVVKHRVGKYGVLVQEFEKLALPSLEKPASASPNLLVIDEIGKMELFSEAFKSKIRDIFSDTSNNVVLATIPMRRGDSLIENIRNHNKAKVWTVTRENRNNIDEEILRYIKDILNLS